MVIATARAKTFLWTGTSAVVWAAVLRKVNGFDTCVFRTREIDNDGPRPDGFEFATETETKELSLRDVWFLQRDLREWQTDSPRLHLAVEETASVLQ